MPAITIHIRLLSGDILPVQVKARQGAVKYKTARPILERAVLDHLEKDSHSSYVKFIHDDDEERRLAMGYQLNDAMDISLRIRIQDRLDNSRIYHDGDIVHALIDDLDWSILNDHDSDFE